MWTQEAAPFHATNIISPANAAIDETLAPALHNHAVDLLNGGKLHSMTDVTVAIAEMQLNTNAAVDTFVIIANDLTHRQFPQGLLAIEALRKWAAVNRGPTMR